MTETGLGPAATHDFADGGGRRYPKGGHLNRQRPLSEPGRAP
jgi:hypothetical protein